MFRSQREPDPFVAGGRLKPWLCTGHFVVSVYVPLAVAFYDSFLFIVEPESLVHNGPVRGMRAGSRCLSRLLRPSPTSSLCVFFLLFLPRRNGTTVSKRETDASRDEKSTRRGPLVVKSFFWLTVTRAGRCLSFNEFASSDLSASPRSVTDLSD